MRYFTPDRWLRLQPMAQPDLVHAALLEWYQAIDDYRRELQRILPADAAHADLRALAALDCLHDGVILATWFAGGDLRLLVRPEQPDSPLVSLTYQLAGTPTTILHSFPAEVRTDSLEWMYDEIARMPDEPPVFAHHVLLGNGWELCIPFVTVTLDRPATWLPILETSSTSAEAMLRPTG